jgi:hypothetical protein
VIYGENLNARPGAAVDLRQQAENRTGDNCQRSIARDWRVP